MSNNTSSDGIVKRGVVYVRVSDAEQVNGTSLDDQERQCVEKLAVDRVEIVHKFRDEGVSAKTADREQLMAAVAFCLDRKNRVDIFMVWKVDRFARRTEDHFAIRKLLRDAGVELRSVTEPIGDDPSGKLFEVMLAGFAEFDNAIRALRATNGMRARIRDGVWPFRSPVGYQNRRLRSQDKKKIDPDPTDPVMFPILQRLLKGFARGAYTQSDIVAELRAAGLQDATGTKPTKQFVDKLLRTQLPFYAGLLRDSFGGQVVYYPGRHTPMITADEMRAIEVRRDGGKGVHLPHVRMNPAFPLRGLLVCSVCEKAVTGSSPRGRGGRYSYYHCYRSGCPMKNKGLPKADVERAFEALMARVRLAPAFAEALVRSLDSQFRAEQQSLQERTGVIREEIVTLSERRSRVLHLAEFGTYEPAQATARLHDIDGQIAERRLALSNAEEAGAMPHVVGANAVHALLALMNGTIALSEEERVRFQRILFPQGIAYVKNRGFGTVKTARIIELNRQFCTRKSLSVGRRRLGWNQVNDELRQISNFMHGLEASPLMQTSDRTFGRNQGSPGLIESR